VQRAKDIFAHGNGVLPSSKTAAPKAKSIFARGTGVNPIGREGKSSSTAPGQRAKGVFAHGTGVNPASREVKLSSTTPVQRAKGIFAHAFSHELRDWEGFPASSRTHTTSAASKFKKLIDNMKRWKYAVCSKIWDVVYEYG
jgi:hypothetical protein